MIPRTMVGMIVNTPSATPSQTPVVVVEAQAFLPAVYDASVDVVLIAAKFELRADCLNRAKIRTDKNPVEQCQYGKNIP